MTEIVKKVTVEKFDDEGNLTERVITEYGEIPPPRWVPGIQVGDVWPYAGGGQITTTENPEWRLWNDAVNTFHLSDYDSGPFARRTAGGTDKDRTGEVVDF